MLPMACFSIDEKGARRDLSMCSPDVEAGVIVLSICVTSNAEYLLHHELCVIMSVSVAFTMLEATIALASSIVSGAVKNPYVKT